MAKDPAFLFYPNDYIGGTMGMTFEEKGAYIELLMMQFNRGHMTEHMARHTVGQLWDSLKVKFVVDPQGLYYNERLEHEKLARQNFTKSRRNNLYGTNQHSKPKEEMPGHTTSRMENEDIIVNSNIPNNTIIGKMKKILSENGLVFKELELPQLRESAEFMLNTKSLEMVKESDVKIFEANWTKVVKYALENKKYYGSVSAISKHLTKILTNIETDNGEEMVRYRVPFEQNIKTMPRSQWDKLSENHTLTMVND